MVKDTIKTNKMLQPSDVIVASVLKYRDEMWNSTKRDINSVHQKTLFRLNTILYSPPVKTDKERIAELEARVKELEDDRMEEALDGLVAVLFSSD